MKFYYFRDKDTNAPVVSVAVELNDDNTVDRGIAICSVNDNVCKSEGRDLAIERLENAKNGEVGEPIHWKSLIRKGLNIDFSEVNTEALGYTYDYNCFPTEFETKLFKIKESETDAEDEISVTLDEKIQDVIENFMNNKVMFTAFDVTKVLRSNGNDIKHYEIKSKIHDIAIDLMSDYCYERDSVDINVNDKCISTFVYHDENSDPSDYMINENEDTEVKVETDEVQVYISNRISNNRFHISRNILEQIDVYSNEFIGLDFFDDNSFEIRKFEAWHIESDFNKVLKVYDNGSILISLDEYFGDYIKIEVKDDFILIK